MLPLKLDKLKEKSLSFFLIIPILITLKAFNWKPDLHHDGYAFYPIKMESRGLNPHKDFLEYKGLLFPKLINFLIPNQSLDLYHVRFVIALLLIIASVLFFLILKLYLSYLKSILITTLWIFTNYAWAWQPTSKENFPGSFTIDYNYLSLCFLLMSTYLILSLKIESTQKIKLIKIILAGIFIGLNVWVQFKGFIFLFIFFLNLARKKLKKTVKFLLIFSCSSLIAFIAPFPWLIKINSISEWFHQIILDPFNLMKTGSNIVSEPYSNSLGRILVYSLMFFVTLLVSFLLKSFLSIPIHRIFQKFFLFLFISLISFLPLLFHESQIDNNKNYYYLNWIKLVSGWLPYGIWYSSYVLIFYLITSKFVFYSFNKIKVDQLTCELQSLKRYFLIALGISSIFYIYPNQGYFWYFSPVSYVASIAFFSQLKNRNIFETKMLNLFTSTALTIVLLIPACALYIKASTIPSFAYQSGPLNKMVEFDPILVSDNQNVISFLNHNFHHDKIFFDECIDVFFLSAMNSGNDFGMYYGPLPVRELHKSSGLPTKVLTCGNDKTTSKYWNKYYLLEAEFKTLRKSYFIWTHR